MRAIDDWAAPRRVRLVAVALVLGAVGFAATALVRVVTENSPGNKADMVTLSLVLLVADLIIAGALVTGWYPVRPVAQGLAIFGALVHVLVLLRSGGWVIRGWSAWLSVAHVYALMLFFAFSAEECDEDEDDDRSVVWDEASGPAQGGSLGQTPAEPADEAQAPPTDEPESEAVPAESEAVPDEPVVTDSPAGEPGAEERVKVAVGRGGQAGRGGEQ